MLAGASSKHLFRRDSRNNMGKGKQLNTRVSPEAFQVLMQKCADGSCTTYEYLRQLIHADVGLNVDGRVPEDPVIEAEPLKQTELTKNERDDSGKIRIVG